MRRQAAASTQRFEEGNPLSILDGIFIAVKDDIDCYPHPSKGGATWFHDVRHVKADAVSVSRLRNSGAILVRKTNMHEFVHLEIRIIQKGTQGVLPQVQLRLLLRDFAQRLWEQMLEVV